MAKKRRNQTTEPLRKNFYKEFDVAPFVRDNRPLKSWCSCHHNYFARFVEVNANDDFCVKCGYVVVRSREEPTLEHIVHKYNWKGEEVFK